MVRHYKRKTERQKWATDSMEGAVDAVINGKIGLKRASEHFQVPCTTLKRYIKKKEEFPNCTVVKKLGNYQCVFTKDQELELVAYLKDMQKRLFGFTVKELRTLAYQLAVRNKCKNPFNQQTEMAGEDWVQAFMARHTGLSLRVPEATSGARAMGFNEVSVGQFFDLLNQIIDEKEITGERIYNCDETGISVVPKHHSKIIATKGQRRVGALTSAERGETVTVEICCSASGNFMPPMLIYPRKKKQQEYEIGLPAGGWAELHESGWMTSEIFLRWFRRFIEFSNAKTEKPVLMLLDGHSTHTKNLDLIDLARDNGVILLCLPPHCSHRLQPLDVAFMKPISKYYEDEVRKWLRTNPGKVVTLRQISSLFGPAFVNAASMKTALNGFKNTGIWPPNRNVFTDDDYLPAATTDISMIETWTTTVLDNPQANPATSTYSSNNLSSPPPNSEAETSTTTALDSPQENPSTSSFQVPIVSSFPSHSPQNAIPLPKVEFGVKRKTRKRGKTAILTSSPYKTELKESAEKSKKMKEEKELRAKRKLIEKESKKIAKKAAKLPRRKKQLDYEDAECIYCSELYSTSNEGWIQCTECKKWAHNSCSAVDSEDDDSVFFCAICQVKQTKN